MTELFTMGSSLRRYTFVRIVGKDTRQTTVGAILVDSHTSVAMYFC